MSSLRSMNRIGQRSSRSPQAHQQKIDPLNLSQQLERNVIDLKWTFLFQELQRTLKIFIHQRKHYTPHQIFSDFCEAVSNNPCCTWLRHYFDHSDQIHTLNYSTIKNDEEKIKGLKNLVDDLTKFLCDRTYEKYCSAKEELAKTDLRLRQLKARFKNNYVRKNLKHMKEPGGLVSKSSVLMAATTDAIKIGNFGGCQWKVSEEIDKFEDKPGNRLQYISCYNRTKNSRAGMLYDQINTIENKKIERFLIIDTVAHS
jgi:hypothetical protein